MREEKFTALNERDSLEDMLNAEKQLIRLYAEALAENSCINAGRVIAENLAAATEAKRGLAAQMYARGYIEARPADGGSAKRANENFKRMQKGMKA